MRLAAPLSGAEALACSALSLLATPIIVAYLVDCAGWPFPPLAILLLTMLAGALTFAWARQRAIWRAGEVLALGAIVVATLAWLVWRTRPWYLPLGGGPDLTHHLQLVDFIERHWRLVHDPGVELYLGEMAHYTPGVHLLAAFAGAWMRADGLHAIQAVVSASVALKAGFIFVIALRLLPRDVPRVPLAALSALLLLLPRAYVLDSFMHESFFSQVMSELFAVAMWWAVVAWDDAPATGIMAMFAVAGSAAFLTWPIWIGPPVFALGLVLLVRRDLSFLTRVRHGAIALVPLIAIASVYVYGRVEWLQMARASGAARRPLPLEYGIWLLALSGVGLLMAVFRRKARATVFLFAGIGLQAVVLYVQARANGSSSAYMSFKTLFLLPYPMAAVAVLPLAGAWQLVARWSGDRLRAAVFSPPTSTVLAWALVAFAGYQIAHPIARARRATPLLSEPLYQAGTWAREHLPSQCVEYLVADSDAAYWLHLAVLRNRRVSPRTGDDATFDLEQTVARWYAPGGLPYAIADLSILNQDILADLDVVARFDTAAIVTRRGTAVCPE